MGCKSVFRYNMNNDNEQLNQDLFDMIESHSQNIYDEKMKINYSISKSDSKKMVKANFYLNKKKIIKTVGLSLGIVMVFSSFANLIKNKDSDNLIENNTTVIQNEPIVNKDNVIITEPETLMNDVSVENSNIVDSPLECENKKLFEVGNNKYIDYVYDYMDTSEYNYFKESSLIYGTPSQIMVSLGMQEANLMHDECLPNGQYYNGCAIGILQLEQNCNNVVTAYNYMSNFKEKVEYSDQQLCDIDKNIQVGCMRFQHAIEKYEGNIYVAIQAHNYGEVMMDKALELTATDKNIEVSELLTNYQDLSWLKYVNDIHDNPHKYLSNWKYDTYGDSEYLSKILSYCPTNKITYQYNGNEITFDLQYGIGEIINSKHK